MLQTYEGKSAHADSLKDVVEGGGVAAASAPTTRAVSGTDTHAPPNFHANLPR